MIKKFITLEWKQFFRSSYWQRSIGLNLLMGFFALYMLLNFLVIGFGIYFILKEKFPDQDPLQIVNSYLVYWFLADLIIRYLSQKLPEASIRPLLILPVKKKSIARYILAKSTFSFWVILPLMAFVPFSIVLWTKGYDHTLVLAWLIAVVSLTLSNNYLNFLINKNDKVLLVIGSLLLAMISLDYFQIIPFHLYFAKAFNALKDYPYLALIPVFSAYILYRLVYQNIYKHLYLDDLLKTGKEKIQASNLQFTHKFGDLGIFLKNDIRLIWRNKRPKNVVKASLFMVFYGLIFISMNKNSTHPEKTFLNFVFPAIFMTGIFSYAFGTFIPAWDGVYYSFLMSQNISMKQYLKSKWLLMTLSNLILFTLTIPYIYYGWQYVALLFAMMIFNIGYANLFILWMGAYNTKKIDLDKAGYFNNQGTSARTFIVAFGFLLLPMLIFIPVYKFFGLEAGLGVLIFIGIIGIVFKEYFLTKIAALYKQKKYKTIHGFKQQV